MTQATAIYRSVMVEIERRRLQLGWPMWKLDDAAGSQDGFYAHALYPDGSNGRQSRWETIDLFVSALYPDGFDLSIKPTNSGCLDAGKQRSKIRSAAAYTNARTMREHMKSLSEKGSSKGGIERARRLPNWKRKAIARKAARKRWKEKKQPVPLEKEVKPDDG